VGEVRRDREFERKRTRHLPRHPHRDAFVGLVEPLPAGDLIGHAGRVDGLVRFLERRLLAKARRLRRIVARLAGRGAAPLAGQVGIFRFIECLRARNHYQRRNHDRTEPLIEHGRPPQ
jgi:hypothetical protein